MTLIIIQVSQNILIIVVGKMKDETAGVAIEKIVGLNPKIYSYLVDDNSEHKKEKGVNRNVVATVVITNIKTFCWIINLWDIWWIGFKVKIIQYELTKSTTFPCLAWMIKYAPKTMDLMD